MTGLGLFGTVLVTLSGKRRKASAVVLMLLVVGLLTFVVGCGGPRYNGTPRGPYTVTVTGTSGNVTQSTTFSLTVH